MRLLALLALALVGRASALKLAAPAQCAGLLACGECVDAGCAWQPAATQSCLPECLIADTSCYTLAAPAGALGFRCPQELAACQVTRASGPDPPPPPRCASGLARRRAILTFAGHDWALMAVGENLNGERSLEEGEH